MSSRVIRIRERIFLPSVRATLACGYRPVSGKTSAAPATKTLRRSSLILWYVFAFTYFFFRFMFLEAAMVSEMEIMESLLSIVRAPHDQQDAGGFVYTPREIAQQPESWPGNPQYLHTRSGPDLRVSRACWLAQAARGEACCIFDWRRHIGLHRSRACAAPSAGMEVRGHLLCQYRAASESR